VRGGSRHLAESRTATQTPRWANRGRHRTRTSTPCAALWARQCRPVAPFSLAEGLLLLRGGLAQLVAPSVRLQTGARKGSVLGRKVRLVRAVGAHPGGMRSGPVCQLPGPVQPARRAKGFCRVSRMDARCVRGGMVGFGLGHAAALSNLSGLGPGWDSRPCRGRFFGRFAGHTGGLFKNLTENPGRQGR
jgi:hypothetical protein